LRKPSAQHIAVVQLKHFVITRRLLQHHTLSAVTLSVPQDSVHLQRVLRESSRVDDVQRAGRLRGAAVITAFTGLPRRVVDQIHDDDRSAILARLDVWLAAVSGVPLEDLQETFRRADEAEQNASKQPC
jgi:hypothetical protein